MPDPFALPAPTLEAQAKDAREGHARLDDTRAVECKGSLYDRISWIIELLTREKRELEHIIKASGYEMDALRAKAEAAAHRQAVAEYRAQRIVLDKELLMRAETADAALAAAARHEAEPVMAESKHHHYEPSATDKNICGICGDGPWGIHRFQPTREECQTCQKEDP